MPLNLACVCENTSSLIVSASITQQIINNDEISFSEKIADIACPYENDSEFGEKKDEISHLYVSTDGHHMLGNTIWSAGKQNQTAVDHFHPHIPGIINKDKETAISMWTCV